MLRGKLIEELAAIIQTVLGSQTVNCKTEKFINFTVMAMLTRYNTFKSLKQNSSSKVKKSVNTKTLTVAEVEAFFQLLNKKKLKTQKLKSK